MASNNLNNILKKVTEPNRSTGFMMKAGGAVIAIIIIVFIVYLVNPGLFSSKKEGDVCEMKNGDSRGIYKIDSKGKCALDSCMVNWDVKGNKCVKNEISTTGGSTTGGSTTGGSTTGGSTTGGSTTGGSTTGGSTTGSIEGTLPSGLSGHYTVDSASSSLWKDISGKGNDGVVKGSLKKSGGYVSGGVDDGVKFPVGVMGQDKKYTLFYVGRYNGENKKRIFDGVDNNWLSGWWNGMYGVAHRTDGGWLTRTDIIIGNGDNDWILGTDTSSGIFKVNGTSVGINSGSGSPSQITINDGEWAPFGEASDWALKEVMFFDRVLSVSEITKVEDVLLSKHSISRGEGVVGEYGVKGFFQNGITIGGIGEYGGNQTVDTCRQYAKTAGAKAFGFRNNLVADPAGHNTCFMYGTVSPETVNGFVNDVNHSVYCTDLNGAFSTGC